MYRHKFIPVLIVLTVLAVACSRQSPSPTSPSSAAAATANADDPVTLKATAPRVVSPVNDARLEAQTPSLVIQRATGMYDTSAVFEYRFQLLNEAGATLWDSGALFDTT